MRKTLSVKGVDMDAIELLLELRDWERRQTGAIIGDAIRHYSETIFEDDTESAMQPT